MLEFLPPERSPACAAATPQHPPPPGVRRRLHEVLRSERPDIVLFGALWPLGHMGPAVSRKLAIPYGGFSHGLELTGALAPGVLSLRPSFQAPQTLSLVPCPEMKCMTICRGASAPRIPSALREADAT